MLFEINQIPDHDKWNPETPVGRGWGTVGVNLCTTTLLMAAKELSLALNGLISGGQNYEYVLPQHALKLSLVQWNLLFKADFNIKKRFKIVE